MLGTVVVFWPGHVFAMAVEHRGLATDGNAAFRQLPRYSLVQSLGLLIAAVVPLNIVLLRVANLIRDDVAVWTTR